MSRLILFAAFIAFAAWLIVRAIRTRRFSLQDKIVLITGGSRGLGLVLARQICAESGKVALLARDADELARAKTDLIPRLREGGGVLTIQCDLLDAGQMQSAVRQIIDRFGKIDILINNAGIIEVGPLEHMTREDFERAMQLHFWAPFELISQIVPEMRTWGGGRIVNISSIGGKIAIPHMAPYTASKFALVGLSDALRAELARDSIYITTVTPGLMRTGSEGHAKFKGDEAAECKAFTDATKLPFASISAERAARKVLAACRRGQPALIMPMPARALIIASALFPNLTASVLKMLNKRLPPPIGTSGNDARARSDIR
jgi:NAD(P)-dependent dehydrogenase (short-subunit alcohol dehydrogenase family)